MAAPDIIIGLKTTGDTAGAENVEKSIFAVEDAAKQASREMDVAEAKRRQAGGAGEGGLEKQVDTIAMLQKAQVISQLGAQLAQIGPKFNEIAESVRGFDSDLADSLETTGQVVSKAGEAASTIALGFAAGGPVGAALATAFVAVKELAGGWVEMKQAEHDAEEAAKGVIRQQEHINKLRAFNKEHAGDKTRLHAIREENAAMHEQEDSFRRMIELQNILSNQAASAAGKEVQLAKLKGGDVALAEANLIAATMKSQLDELNGKLASGREALERTASDELLAVGRLRDTQNRVKAGLIKTEDAGLEGLEETARRAGEKQETARANLNTLLSSYQGAQQNIVRDAEISLETKEQEYAGKTSTAAAKAFGGVYKSLGEELAKGPEDAKVAIGKIKADAATVTTAAESKAQEVSTQMQAASVGSVQAVQSVGQTAATAAGAIQKAVGTAQSQVNVALDKMTNEVVTSLAKIAANVIKNSNRIAVQQSQINQIMARIR